MRTVVATVSVGLLAATAAACGGSDAGGSDSGEITLGVLGPISGAQAQIGQNQVAGAEVAVAQINAQGGINGRKVKLVTQDEGASPETAAAAIRKVANDGVPLQLGMLSSANCLATAPTLPKLKVVMVGAGCTNDGLTGSDGKDAPHPNFFRVGNADSPMVTSLAKVIAQKFPGVTDYDAFGYNYVTGTSQWKIFQETVKQNGVALRPRKETFVALGEQNFKPYVQALASAPGDPKTRGLYLGTYGAGTASFLQQAQDLNLASKYAVIVQPGGYYPVARTLGGRAPQVWNAYDYSYAAFDSEMNDAFVKDFEAKTGKKPVSWSYDAYLAVYAYKAAIEKAGSAEYDKVLKALPGIEFDSPAGKLTIDAKTHQADTPVVVTFSVGDPSASETVKILETQLVKPGA
ncbi:ABC transporter substrate-binding protein [Phytohabitans kaempferiae]|uniref:ABC transporter substrate-binding protein n=1 Tax=Phytohabitans kaempferiae TaxID=1620943 RepID=A0ABV6MAN4_9ACTN